jgi:hypothetical protein
MGRRFSFHHLLRQYYQWLSDYALIAVGLPLASLQFLILVTTIGFIPLFVFWPFFWSLDVVIPSEFLGGFALKVINEFKDDFHEDYC